MIAKWEPPKRPSVSLSRGDLYDRSFTVAQKRRVLDECSSLTLKRLADWTSDQRAFSRGILACARPTPPSNAYLLGNVRSGEGGFLDSGLGGSPTDEALKMVPNPAHAFRLQWHRASLHEKLPDIRLPSGLMEDLTRQHSIQALYDISAIVSKDANYAAQPERFPGITRLIEKLKK